MAAKKKSPKKPQERNLTRELSLLLAKTLLPDLEARAQEPSVARALAAQYESERKHTADTLAEWTTRTLEQVAVAWILSCVFIRTLEDRGYLTHRRLAGEGAADSEHLFFDLFPSLTQRDYLLAVFRELSHLPGGEEVLAPKHNPAWRLAPTTEAVRTLLAFFREADSEGKLVWSFAGESTRFLGDLYQDVSEAVRERYALLQTPDFVEEFILDLTLGPAVAEFGLEEVRLIDPTCGSGHFLLGAFRRLFEARQRKAPATAAKEHASAALGQVYGADINPYAAGIARFRLVLAYLQAAGIERLKDAPRISTNVVVADSLLFAADNQTLPFAAVAEDATAWGDRHWQFEEPKEVQRIFSKRFHAVVGNPPYITCKDSVLREEYRRAYMSAAGKFALSAPFTERFFQLAIDSGFVGMINANSFMKREFGKALIEKVLPQFELTRVMDTAGAYIPGHGTPTVLLFGRHRAALSDTVGAVLGKRAEPATPADPANGLVWSSIRDHFAEPAFDNEYISVAEVSRSSFAKHPWSMGGGGTAELKVLIEERALRRLGACVAAIGFGSFSGEDAVFICAAGAFRRMGIDGRWIRPLVRGEDIRDWSISRDEEALCPYDAETHEKLTPSGAALIRYLWKYRTLLSMTKGFAGETKADGGTAWWEWYRWISQRYCPPLPITYAYVATHNHFVLGTAGQVYRGGASAPIIKLPDSATEDDHLALLAYLNSSTACFWMKQVCHNKTNASQKHSTDPARAAYEFAGTALKDLPIPDLKKFAAGRYAADLLHVAGQRDAWISGNHLQADDRAWSSAETLLAAIQAGWAQHELNTARGAYLQEEIDWRVYATFGLTELEVGEEYSASWRCPLGGRPFEAGVGYTDGVSDRAKSMNATGGSNCSNVTANLPASWASRRPNANPWLDLLETRPFKRVWRDTERNTDQQEFRNDLTSVWCKRTIVEALEAFYSAAGRLVSSRGAQSALAGQRRVATALEVLGQSDTLSSLLVADAVPFASAYRYTDSGQANREVWEAVWELQRREDSGETVDIPVPARYDSKDFRDPTYWRLRGKLDVAKERFISYPGAEKDDDRSPLFGWAGWDHLQQATALAGLYHERKTEDGWPADRLVPLLAGLLELVPWLKQWHNEPNDELGGEGPGDWYERYVEAESRSIGKTLQDLRDWRPAKGRGSKAT